MFGFKKINNSQFHTPLPALLLEPSAMGVGKGICEGGDDKWIQTYIFSKQVHHFLNFKIHHEQIQAEVSFEKKMYFIPPKVIW